MQGSTAMMSACASGSLAIVILFLSRGADFRPKNNKVSDLP